MSATVVTSENLAEFNASKMGISFAPEPAAAAEPAEPAGEVTTPEETPSEVEGEATQQEDQKSEKSKIDKRFGELTKQREDAKRDAAREREAREALEAKLKDLEAKVNPPKEEKTDEKPQPGQFTDAYEYAEALAEWSAENALKARDKKNAEQQEAIERNKVVKAWTERQNAAKVAMPDYEETLSASTVEVSDFVKQAIVESEVGPQLLYHLAKNPEIAEGLAKKSPASALREIGRLEAALSGDKKPTPEKTAETPSKAPEPISPIRATKAVDSPIDSKGEFHGTYAQWKAARQAGKIK